MSDQIEAAPRKEQPRKETVTPFLERSITELIGLFAQLFTTPFAILSFNKPFRDQVTALSKDDIETAHPETVARPLSFFFLLMTAHFLLSGIYWRMVLPGPSLPAALSRSKESVFVEGAKNILKLFETLAAKTGRTEAIILVAFAMTLIIAVKTYLVSTAGRLLRSPIRFKTALYASGYAVGAFVFFQYVFIGIRYLAAIIVGDVGFRVGYAVIAYGSLALSILLVVRVNQIMRQADGTAQLPTYLAWLSGTVVWHWIIVLCAGYVLNGTLAGVWMIYWQFWAIFGKALYPPAWQGI
jgi:hypothetical protein